MRRDKRRQPSEADGAGAGAAAGNGAPVGGDADGKPDATHQLSAAADDNDVAIPNYQGFVTQKAAECMLLSRPFGAFVVWRTPAGTYAVTFRSEAFKRLETVMVDAISVPTTSARAAANAREASRRSKKHVTAKTTGMTTMYAASKGHDKTLFPSLEAFCRSRRYLNFDIVIPRDIEAETRASSAAEEERKATMAALSKKRRKLERERAEMQQRLLDELAPPEDPNAVNVVTGQGLSGIMSTAWSVTRNFLWPLVLALGVAYAVYGAFVAQHFGAASAHVERLNSATTAHIEAEGPLSRTLAEDLRPWLARKAGTEALPAAECVEAVHTWAAEVTDVRQAAQADFERGPFVGAATTQLVGFLCASLLAMTLMMRTQLSSIDAKADWREPVGLHAWHGPRSSVRFWGFCSVASVMTVVTLVMWFMLITDAAAVSTTLHRLAGQTRIKADRIALMPTECREALAREKAVLENVPPLLRLPLLGVSPNVTALEGVLNSASDDVDLGVGAVTQEQARATLLAALLQTPVLGTAVRMQLRVVAALPLRIRLPTLDQAPYWIMIACIGIVVFFVAVATFWQVYLERASTNAREQVKSKLEALRAAKRLEERARERAQDDDGDGGTPVGNGGGVNGHSGTRGGKAGATAKSKKGKGKANGARA